MNPHHALRLQDKLSAGHPLTDACRASQPVHRALGYGGHAGHAPADRSAICLKSDELTKADTLTAHADHHPVGQVSKLIVVGNQPHSKLYPDVQERERQRHILKCFLLY